MYFTLDLTPALASVRRKEALKRCAKGTWRKGDRATPVAAPNDNDIEMDCESVKKVNVDLINKPTLSPAKSILCQY
jgi:hypothetical protein